MKPIKVAIFGVNGKMGTEVCRAVTADSGLELVAGVDVGDPREQVLAADVVVDFTHPDTVIDNIAWCVDHGLNTVVGTSGFDAERYDQIDQLASKAGNVGVLIAPNFSIGAVLMMHFAKIAAPFFDSVEVIETHHPHKIDAPSGTAAQTARLIAEAREKAGAGSIPDATTHAVEGARGADINGVRVHSLRVAGMIARQEVHFGSVGESLIIGDDARDRSSFMPGVLQGIRWIGQHPGLTIGLEKVLGLAS